MKNRIENNAYFSICTNSAYIHKTYISLLVSNSDIELYYTK